MREADLASAALSLTTSSFHRIAPSLTVHIHRSCLGIALVPPIVAGALRTDPVAVLLGGGAGAAIAAATAATAACAILTTLIGTLRALSTFCLDGARSAGRAAPTQGTSVVKPGTNSDKAEVAKSSKPPLWRGWWAGSYALMALVPAAIAGTASVTDAFFGAIDLAGAYPVALLWGLVPPLMALRLRARSDDSGVTSRKWSHWVLLALVACSAAFVSSNLVGDFGWLFKQGANARWR